MYQKYLKKNYNSHKYIFNIFFLKNTSFLTLLYHIFFILGMSRKMLFSRFSF